MSDPKSETPSSEFRVPSSKAPFFIVGCPRSGTTLLQVLLDAHPNIAIPPESFIFHRFGGMFESYGDLSDDVNLRAFVEELLEDERIIDWKLNISGDELTSRVTERTARGVIETLFAAYADMQEKQRWGDKTPQHVTCLPNITAVFPDARFIHFVRDGRDIAESLSRVFIGPKSIYAIAHYWRKHVSAFAEFKKSLSAESYIEPRYEDLVADSGQQRDGIIEFLGEIPHSLEGDENAVPETASKQQAVGAVSHHASLAGPISTGKVGIYKTRFTERQIEIFESVAGDMLKLYGYELENENPRPPTALEKLCFAATDLFYRYGRKLFRPEPIRHLSKELKLKMQYRARRKRRVISEISPLRSK